MVLPLTSTCKKVLFYEEKFWFGVNFQLLSLILLVAGAGAACAPWSFADQGHPWFPPGRRKQFEHVGCYGNAASQQHFLLISLTGKPWDCAQ